MGVSKYMRSEVRFTINRRWLIIKGVGHYECNSYATASKVTEYSVVTSIVVEALINV